MWAPATARSSSPTNGLRFESGLKAQTLEHELSTSENLVSETASAQGIDPWALGLPLVPRGRDDDFIPVDRELDPVFDAKLLPVIGGKLEPPGRVEQGKLLVGLLAHQRAAVFGHLPLGRFGRPAHRLAAGLTVPDLHISIDGPRHRWVVGNDDDRDAVPVAHVVKHFE